MRQLATMIGDAVNNPVVESTACSNFGDNFSKQECTDESAGYVAGVWNVSFEIVTSAGESVTVATDYLAMVPGVMKSEWFAPAIDAINTLNGWGVVLATDHDLLTGGKPVYTWTYTGPSNNTMTITMTKPDGTQDVYDIGVGTDGVMTILASDQWGPVGTPVMDVGCP